MSEIAPWLENSRWPTVPIRYLAKLGTGHTPSRQKPEYWENCTVPWVTLADVWQLRDGTVDVIRATKERLSSRGLANSAAVKHPAGTVILSRTASVGFSAIMGDDMATSQDFATWTCGRQLHPKFLLYVLRAMAPDLRRVAAGSTHKTIYMPDIEELRTPLPPLDEQRRIAEFLDDEIARINQLARMRRLQADLISERLFVFGSELVMPGITDETARNKTWPWVPAVLSLSRLGHCARIQSGVTVDSSRSATEDDVEVPYLRVANVQGGEIDLSEVAYIRIPRVSANKALLRAGDVVITEANGNPNNLGRGAVWDGSIPGMIHQNHIFAIRPDRRKLLAEFLSLLLASLHGRRYFLATSNQVGIATTSSSKVLSMPIPVISVSRQAEVVAEYRRMFEAFGRAAKSLNRQLALLSERRQVLTTAAVTGQMDVTVARRADI